MGSTAVGKTGWQKVARRIRVPLGFVVAGVVLVFARPTLRSMVWSLALVVPGLWLRAYAAGYVRKNAELTRTGPYAYTRNPLYLGSMGIAAGFAVAAGRWWLGALLVTMFLAIYVPTILSEEAFLRGQFAGFEEYMRRVPRLLPRLTAARFEDAAAGAGAVAGSSVRAVSRERYLHHREYNSLIGAAAIYAALALRMAVGALRVMHWHAMGR